MTDITYPAAPLVAIPAERRRLRRRHLWLIPGLALAIFANQLGEQHGVGILQLIVLSIAPDLPRLLRYRGQPLGRRLAGLAIPASNLLHQPLVAFAAAAFAAAGAVNQLIPVAVLVATLVWLGHIVIGWAVGDGIRKVEVAR
jgi:hypothetical protein